MKRIKFKLRYLVIIAFSCMITIGCEDLRFGNGFLEQPAYADMNIDSVFSQKIYADQLLTQIYHTLPDYMSHSNRLSWTLLEGITDIADVTKAGGNSYHKGTISAATSSEGAYSMSYNTEDGEFSATYCFRLANIYLENVDRVPDMTEDEKLQGKGEARMLKAIHYVQMLRNLGGMPWIDKVYSPDDEMIFNRMTVEEHVAKTVELIDQAVADLPWSVSSVDNGRMTAAAGYALKTRLLLFAASPLFNSDEPFMEGDAADAKFVWYGNYDASRWEDARDACMDFLDKNQENGNFYQLVDDPSVAARYNYRSGYFDRYNGEVLIASHRFTYIYNSKAVDQIRYGAATPSLNYADMFPMADGSDFSWDNAQHSKYPFFDADLNMVRDPRIYETLILNQDEFWSQANGAEIYIGGQQGPTTETFTPNWRWGSQGNAGIAMRKYVLDQLDQLQNQFYQCPLMRLPEVYLNMAEAMNEMGIATTKDKYGRDAYDYVNLVRSRVDLPGITSSQIDPGEELREAILRERVLEFGYEEVRYYDIVRWKLKKLLETPLRMLTTTPVEGSTTEFNYEIVTGMVNERIWVERWSDRYYLSPIPLTEISNGSGLIQNPGW